MREMLMNTSSSSSGGFDINELVQEARNRWLKPAEVLFILQNHENHQLTEAPPQKPPSGSLFLFNKRVLRFFRKDGHSWRKKKDGRTVGEAHERLKVGTCEALNCYYAHGEHNPSFQRRSYWMLDPAYEHIVLVHYRETSERRYSAAPTSNLSPDSSLLSQNPSFYSSNPGSSSAVSELYEPYRSSFSPGSVEVSSELVVQNIGVDNLDGKDISAEYISSPKAEVSQALRRLEEQLSLNDDDTAHLFPPYAQNEKPKDYGVQNCEREHGQDSLASFQFGSDFGENQQYFNESAGMTDDSYTFLQSSVDNKKQPQQFGHEYTLERKDSPYWKEMLELCSGTAWVGSQDKSFNSLDRVDKPLADGLGKKSAYLAEETEKRGSTRLDLSRNYSVNRSNCFPSSEDNFSTQLSAARQFLLGTEDFASPTSVSLLQEVKSSEIPIYSSGPSTYETNPDNQTMWFDQESQPGISFSGNSTLTLAEKQRFSIGEISPEWGYSTEDTKVIITGSFLCDPSECVWSCMFGDLEVPAQIIQEGVLRCHAPPHVSGKVTLCITSGNRESCSEIREFDYITKPSSCSHCDLTQKDVTKSTEELLLLVRLAQMLLCDPLDAKEDSIASGVDVLKRLKTDEDLWGYMIEGLLMGSGTSSNTLDWLIQEFVKDKLLQWLSSKYQEEESSDCSLSKKEQGIIHMVAALGFEWALIPILNAGVSINFRDINGWTALHWAARFGREKMVAALLAAGASAVAVTDPTSQDPAGKTAGSVAVASGHKGLAGYLSEVALTSRLSSLTLGETEISKGSAAVEAERTVESISKERLGSTEDQISLKDSLAAVRNATQAAARIQSAFRAHSFRRRQQEEVTSGSYDEYGIAPEYIHSLSAASKLAFRNRDHKFDKAALSIQKKYRGWKDRKDFLAFRQKVVRIQAHVRGHQVRKKYKQFLWAVGILDKVVLRWRRRGAGLRGFKPELESIDESEDEDILKVFRKQKVNVAIEEAVSQVMSMVESPEARRQYGRMLESFRQAKAELSERRSETPSTSQGVGDMESDIDDEFDNLIQWEDALESL